MARYVELWRHTDNDGDTLSDEGVRAALEVGRSLTKDYTVAVSTGAQRATQTIACLLAAAGKTVKRGVIVDARLRSEMEERWKDAYTSGGGGDLSSFEKVDPELVTSESKLFAEALLDLLVSLPQDGRALVVGHSPMQEAAVYGLTGKAVEPLGKGEGVLLIEEDGSYRLESLG